MLHSVCSATNSYEWPCIVKPHPCIVEPHHFILFLLFFSLFCQVMSVVNPPGAGYKGAHPPDFSLQLPSNPFTPKRHPVTNDYTILTKTLGVGVSGKVLACISKTNGTKCALKVSMATLGRHRATLQGGMRGHSPLLLGHSRPSFSPLNFLKYTEQCCQ